MPSVSCFLVFEAHDPTDPAPYPRPWHWFTRGDPFAHVWCIIRDQDAARWLGVSSSAGGLDIFDLAYAGDRPGDAFANAGHVVLYVNNPTPEAGFLPRGVLTCVTVAKQILRARVPPYVVTPTQLHRWLLCAAGRKFRVARIKDDQISWL